jgi:hypothetical protein
MTAHVKLLTFKTHTTETLVPSFVVDLISIWKEYLMPITITFPYLVWPWVGFKLITLAVIGTDCIGSYTITTAPWSTKKLRNLICIKKEENSFISLFLIFRPIRLDHFLGFRGTHISKLILPSDIHRFR